MWDKGTNIPLLINKETGAIVKVPTDMVKGLEADFESGIYESISSVPDVEPGWVKKVEKKKEPVHAPNMVERALDAITGASYELAVDGRRRRSGIIVGFDQQTPNLDDVNVLVLEDTGRTGVTEGAYSLRLMLSGRGHVGMRVHFSGLAGVFAKGRLIQAARGV